MNLGTGEIIIIFLLLLSFVIILAFLAYLIIRFFRRK